MNFFTKKRIISLRMIVLVIFIITIQLFAGNKVNSQTKDLVVTGLVTDATNGESLPGVGVKLKGSSIATSTDSKGRYSIKVPGNAILIFSYIGYLAREIAVNDQTNIQVKLSVEDKSLTEVVVVGYGTQKKASLTTAVGSVEGKAVAERGTVSPMKALQGQIAGVDIKSTSGRAGSSSFSTQIRGQNSLAGGQPLFVVDGVIVDDINYLNPQDISKIDVLKDAASTAIYGSRGSNGVILVTTKLAGSAKGAPTISLDSYYGSRQVARMPDFMNGDQQWELLQNSFITNGMINNTPYDANSPARGNAEILRRINEKDYTNWRDIVLKTGNQQNHWLTASGTSGDNNIQYIIGAGYQNEKGNLVNEALKRYNFKASVETTISEKWRAGMNINFTRSDLERGSNVAINNAFRQLDFYAPYDIKDGSLAFQPGQIWDPVAKSYTGYGTFVNPILELANSQNNTKTNFALGNIFLQFSPLKWIDIRSTFSPRVNSSRNGLFSGPQTQERNGNLSSAQVTNRQTFAYIMDNMVTVNKTIKEHNFSFTGLYSIQNDEFESSVASVADLPFESGWYNMGSTLNRTNTGSSYAKVSLISYVARLNYAYKDKYLASVVNRWDGASKLAAGRQWASFPSASVGWVISQEDFLKTVKFVSEAKLRFSVGEAGNNNNINPYETQALLSNPALYDFGGTPASGYMTNRLANGALTWERTREYNLGLDFGLFKGRVSGTVEVYDKLSKGVLMERNIPVESGWSSIKDNVGSVSNKGIEAALRTQNVASKDFTWSTSFTFARNKNAIEELLGKRVDLPANSWFIGKPVNVFYNYVLDGVWQESERAQALIYSQTPGQSKVKDLNSDNKISNPEDRAILGQIDPKWTGGFSTHFTYKNIDLSASLYARQGMLMSSRFNADFLRYDGLTNYVFLNGDYYMPPNNVNAGKASNFYPQPNNAGPYWRGLMHITPNSFVKIQHITLGYTFPAGLLQKARIKSLRVYANVLDPFVFTKYKGFDPETDGDVNAALNDTGVASITYQFGINLKF